MTNTYKSPILASVDGGYEDLRNTPFSIGTYKIVFNTQFEPPTAPGTTAFNRRFQLTTPLRGVKKIRLLYARFPQVGESAVGAGNGTDALISIQIREFKGKYTSTHPKRNGRNVSNLFSDNVQSSFVTLLNETVGVGTLNYKGYDYDVIEYFSTPIVLDEVTFNFFNSTGIEIGYAVGANIAVNQIILAMEVTCQGVR